MKYKMEIEEVVRLVNSAQELLNKVIAGLDMDEVEKAPMDVVRLTSSMPLG